MPGSLLINGSKAIGEGPETPGKGGIPGEPSDAFPREFREPEPRWDFLGIPAPRPGLIPLFPAGIVGNSPGSASGPEFPEFPEPLPPRRRFPWNSRVLPGFGGIPGIGEGNPGFGNLPGPG